jgi:hypothetical protein
MKKSVDFTKYQFLDKNLIYSFLKNLDKESSEIRIK